MDTPRTRSKQGSSGNCILVLMITACFGTRYGEGIQESTWTLYFQSNPLIVHLCAVQQQRQVVVVVKTTAEAAKLHGCLGLSGRGNRKLNCDE
ncbi:hypothetical protein E2C01_051335 [Portunus trituberculatus]|uniref:Secreted protein n=1 Tax=Portunus trituberculatus TaxID=210409 RepID=A0A5B7GIE4_PORTR|nr:hypothetical protein [Portunus trituberculatus]